MTRTPLLLVILTLLAAGCSEPVSEKVVATWPDGSPKEIHSTRAGEPGHETQQFHANGRAHVRGRLVDGVREGVWNTFRENGLPWSQVEYLAGEKDGGFRTWHENGLPHIEGQHRAGKPSGMWHFFDTMGQPTESRNFDEDPKLELNEDL